MSEEQVIEAEAEVDGAEAQESEKEPEVLEPSKVEASSPEDIDWRSLITSDDNKKAAERFNSVDDALKSVSDLRKEISNRIKVPGKDASEEDLAKFRKAIGASDKVEDYQKPPEGFELGEVDQAIFGRVAEIAHAEGLPVSAFGKFSQAYLEMVNQANEAAAAEAEKFYEDQNAALDKKWGKEAEANRNIANRAMMQLGGEEMAEWLTSTKAENGQPLANQAQLVELFAKLGRQMSEDGVINPNDPETVKAGEQEMDQLTRKAHAAQSRGDNREAARLFKERDKIASRIYGDA